MKDAETYKGTDIPCEKCGNTLYHMGNFSTKCCGCGASIIDVDTGKTYKSGGKTIYTTPGGTYFEH